MNIDIPHAFEPVWWDKHRFLIMCGGGGSAKSETAARKIIYRCLTEGNHRFVILRKVKATLIDSVIPVFLEILQKEEVPYNHNKSTRRIYIENGRGEMNELIFTGLDDPEKLKSFKGMTSVWMEELSEFNEADFEEVNRRLRGKTKHYKQIIGTLNPDEAQAKWVKERFFDRIDPDTYTHHSTVLDNPFILEHDPEYVDQLRKIKDPSQRKIYLDGVWAEPKGLIFPKFQIIPPEAVPPIWETFYGLDFGYTNPNALLEIGIDKAVEPNRYYFRELLYQTRQTEGELIESLKQLIPDKSRLIVADSEAPARVTAMQMAGFNCVGAVKGPGSVVDQIRFLIQLWDQIYCLPSNKKLIKERSGYKWPENKAGEPDDKKDPINAFGDHLIAAARYAMSFRLKYEYIAGKQVVKSYKRQDRTAGFMRS